MDSTSRRATVTLFLSVGSKGKKPTFGVPLLEVLQTERHADYHCPTLVVEIVKKLRHSRNEGIQYVALSFHTHAQFAFLPY